MAGAQTCRLNGYTIGKWLSRADAISGNALAVREFSFF